MGFDFGDILHKVLVVGKDHRSKVNVASQVEKGDFSEFLLGSPVQI